MTMARYLLLLLSTVALHAGVVQYAYDSLNRLIRTAYPDGTVIVYTYDSAGNRLSQIITNPAVPAPKAAVDKANLSFTASTGQASTATQMVVVSNSGGGSLQWNAVPSVPWLSVTPGSGANSGAIAVAASATGLTAGNYSGNLVIYASASNAPLAIPVSLTVSAGSGRPGISQGGVVTAAGYTSAVARGAVGSLYGVGLADSTDSAPGVPLPRTLAGVSVAVNGVGAPLWFVSPGQINFQVPFETPMAGAVPVVVNKNGVASEVMNVQVQPYAPGIFMYERAAGVLDPIIVRAANNDIVSPSNPALPGDNLTIYGTGLGNLTTIAKTGEGAPSSPLAKSTETPTITVGGTPVEVQFSGLTPGGIGLAQFNIKVPTSLAQKDSLPLVIQFGTVSSPAVNLAIRSAGPAKPDVTIQVTDVQPPKPLATDNLWLNEDIKNPSSFRGGLVTKLYVSDSAEVTVDSAKATGTTTLTLNGTGGSFTYFHVPLPQGLKPGIYYVAVGLMFPGNTDPQGIVLSNAMQIEVVAERPPFDLSVQLKDASPTVVGAGDPVTLHYAVSEPSGMSGTFSSSVYLSNTPTVTSGSTLVKTWTVDVVKGSVDLTSTGNSIPRGMAAGNYYVGAIVQTSGDTNPSNNTSSALPITVTSVRTPFDIGVQIASVTPATMAPGGTFTVTYNIKNTSKSTGNYYRWVYLSTDDTIGTSDQLLSTNTFSITGDDAQISTNAITMPASVAPGKYYIGMIVETQGDNSPADNISPAVVIQVGSPIGANAVSVLGSSEPRAVMGGGDTVQDLRTDGTDVTSEPGRTGVKENPKPKMDRQ